MAKRKEFSKVTAVKDAARVLVGMPKATRAIPDPKRRAEGRQAKHKKPLSEWIDEGLRVSGLC